MATNPFPRISVEDYFALDDASTDQRYEYVDGIPYLMAGGTLHHAAIIGNTLFALKLGVRSRGCQAYASDARMQLAGNRYLYPDVVVTCDQRDRNAVKAVQWPCLVIEVTSPRTGAYDRGYKADLYRSCMSIQEYLFIDSERVAVDLFRRENEFWRFQSFGSSTTFHLASIDLDLTVAELYADITLPETPGLPIMPDQP